MKNRNKVHFGIADHAASRRKHVNEFLDIVNELIDWRPFIKLLDKKLQRKANAVGNPSYPSLAMFKILLLQRWYNLSDLAMEQTLCDRLSFMRFVEFSLEQDTPDETTICRFRNGLIKIGILEQLLEMLNIQLEQKNLLVREGAIVDASIVESSQRPRKVVDIATTDREEDNEDQNSTISYSKDADAAWLRKGNRVYYGHKIHVATDIKDGFFLGGYSTPANKSDTGEFTQLVGLLELTDGSIVFADKGYSSKKNSEFLESKNFLDAIMYKAARNKPLTDFQRAFNKFIGKIRFKGEQFFGTAKRKYGFSRARYIGTPKVDAELLLTGIAFNIKKAVRMLET